MLLRGELLQQVVVGGVGGGLALGHPVVQPVLVRQQHPDLSAPVLGNTYTHAGEGSTRSVLRVHKRAGSVFFPAGGTCTWLHLGTERGTSPPCPAGRWFCPEPSASSPTTPARLWSTGPLPGSPASSCGCAARLGSLRRNQRSHGKRNKQTTARSNSRRPKLPYRTRGKRNKN